MIRLDLKTEPYWIELVEGVRVKVWPLTPGLFSACQLYAHTEVQKRVTKWDEKKGSNAGNIGLNLDDDNIRSGLISEYMATFLAVNSIIEWEGVLHPKGDDIVPVCEEKITALFQIFGVASTFYAKYTRAMDEVLTEGNGSGPAQSGTSQKAAGPGTAKGAKTKTSPVQKEK